MGSASRSHRRRSSRCPSRPRCAPSVRWAHSPADVRPGVGDRVVAAAGADSGIRPTAPEDRFAPRPDRLAIPAPMGAPAMLVVFQESVAGVVEAARVRLTRTEPSRPRRSSRCPSTPPSGGRARWGTFMVPVGATGRWRGCSGRRHCGTRSSSSRPPQRIISLPVQTAVIPCPLLAAFDGIGRPSRCRWPDCSGRRRDPGGAALNDHLRARPHGRVHPAKRRRVHEAGRGPGVGDGVVAAAAQVVGRVVDAPPQTIISVPVHTAVW